MPRSSEQPPHPRVVVLLATHNGARWLDEQLDSILGQADVSVRVVALDDESSDGTVQLLTERVRVDARLTVLPSQGRAGSAAANFYRLIQSAAPETGELIALSDQDDIWMQGKLARHAALLGSLGADGVSSNVTSFTSTGARTLVRKNYPQRRFDYLLESPGPGSTFLMTPRLFDLVGRVLAENDKARLADYHDWLIYAIARARGWTWHIDAEPSVDYRQHADNAMGSNVGARSAARRLGLVRSRWHRRQAALLAQIGLSVAEPESHQELQQLHHLFIRSGPRARFALLRLSGQLRRRPRDRGIIGMLIATGLW